jgi:hypothetical protein
MDIDIEQFDGDPGAALRNLIAPAGSAGLGASNLRAFEDDQEQVGHGGLRNTEGARAALSGTKISRSRQDRPAMQITASRRAPCAVIPWPRISRSACP